MFLNVSEYSWMFWNIFFLVVVLLFKRENFHQCSRLSDSNWIKPVLIGSNLSKLDQTCPNWIGYVQIGSDMSKLD
jgi:hypothetical protein